MASSPLQVGCGGIGVSGVLRMRVELGPDILPLDPYRCFFPDATDCSLLSAITLMQCTFHVALSDKLENIILCSKH